MGMLHLIQTVTAQETSMILPTQTVTAYMIATQHILLKTMHLFPVVVDGALGALLQTQTTIYKNGVVRELIHRLQEPLLMFRLSQQQSLQII